MTTCADRIVRDAWRGALEPPPSITVSEWADENLRLDDTTSSEPGPYRTARTPYVREPMECLSAGSPVQRVVLMWGSQVGKSTLGNAWVGYVVDNSPGPMLVVAPRVQDALDYSRTRIEPMIGASPSLSRRVAGKWIRDGGNTLQTKKFPGGVLIVTGANSAAGLKARPIRYLFMDEVDEYPRNVEEQGDPVMLAVRRTNTFGHRRKVLLTATPTVTGRSRIAAEFEESDRRRYHVPCPSCGLMQPLLWGGPNEDYGFKWPKGRPEAVQYLCASCGSLFPEVVKREILGEGDWVAEGAPGLVAGFHLPSWYSPLGWLSWPEIAKEWAEQHGDPNALMVFVNTVMAETFEKRGEAPAWERLYERRESGWVLGQVPDGVEFLTVGVDVQDTWVEGYVWGWGWNKESWLVDHVVIDSPINLPETKVALTELLHRSYPSVDGEGSFPIAGLAIDAGNNPEPVYTWAREVADRRVIPVKGASLSGWTFVLGTPQKAEVTYHGKRRDSGVLLWQVGTQLLKQEFYGFLELPVPKDGEPYPPGYVHLPMVDPDMCKQLVSEDLVTKPDGKREWQKNQHRNEALDARNYARAEAERQGLGRMVGKRPLPKTKKKPEAKKQDERSGWLDRSGGRQRRGPWL